MYDQLLRMIRSTGHDGDFSVDNTLDAARSAQDMLSEIIDNLERIQDLELEIGDLVETPQGGGIVKGFGVAGTVAVDLPSGEERFSSDTFSASDVRKPTPKEKLERRVGVLVDGSVDGGRLDSDEVAEVLEDLASAIRSDTSP